MTSHSAEIDPFGTPAEGSSTACVPWWSFTKTLIAVAALRLVEQKKLDLDRTFPDFPSPCDTCFSIAPGSEITARCGPITTRSAKGKSRGRWTFSCPAFRL